MHKPKFEIFTGVDQQFYFRLRAANSEIILASEGYTTKQSCEGGISSVKTNAPHDERFVRSDKPGNFSFNLVAGNGEIIGRSESYTTAQSRENGIAAIKRDAPVSEIRDLTL